MAVINFYCRSCGLYISVPGEFAGGRGVCPRCKTPLRIPRPLPENHPDYVEGLRYLADPFDAASLPPTERPPIVTADFGPSARYTCRNCGRIFETLRPIGRPPGQCPNCLTITDVPAVPSVEFAREYATQARSAAPAAPAEGGWIMDGDVLVAPRSANQNPSDSIIQGVPLRVAELQAATVAPAAVSQDLSELERHVQTAPSSKAENNKNKPADETDRRRWFYLLREHQHGPVSTARLKQLIQSGKVGLSVLVFHDGLKGWRPVEDFEELRACARPAEPRPATVDFRAASSAAAAQELKRVHQQFVRLLWLFIAAGCIFTLGVVMHQSLYALGRTFFVRANMILASLIFLAVLYGAFLLKRCWVVFRRAPLSVRLRTWIGMGGLAICLVTTLTLALTWRDEGQKELDHDSILTAQQVFMVLRKGEVEGSFVSVDWDNLRVNGADFGERFRRAETQEQRQKLMDDACEVFLRAFEPYYVSDDLNYPLRLGTWRVVYRGGGDTLVEVRIPSTGRLLRFTLRANRLIRLDLL